MSVDPSAVRAISWAELKAGRWTDDFTDPPCSGLGTTGYGLLAVGRRWPEWRTGKPPTWADFVAAQEIDAADRRWLVARVLLRNRRLLIAWATDCAEAIVRIAGSHEAAIRTDVIAPLRAWIAGDDSIDLTTVRNSAWAIVTATDAAAAYAAAYAAHDAADAATGAIAIASATLAADAAAADEDDTAMLRLALPHLAALESRS